MQMLIELAPLLAFFGTWAVAGIYVATAVLMGAMALLLAWDWFTTRKIPNLHLLSAVLVWVFGTVTLLLHDVRFIQWKFTVYYWIVALAMLGSLWIGKKPLLERLLGGALPEGANIPAARWRNCSLAYAAFCLALGAVNLWVAYTMSESAWMIFKSWISIPVLAVFTFALLYWLLHDQDLKETA